MRVTKVKLPWRFVPSIHPPQPLRGHPSSLRRRVLRRGTLTRAHTNPSPPMATAKLDHPDSATPFALSRSKVELFVDCPRCFYLDRRSGIARPPGFPFNLNSAVDALLKPLQVRDALTRYRQILSVVYH